MFTPSSAADAIAPVVRVLRPPSTDVASVWRADRKHYGLDVERGHVSSVCLSWLHR